MSDAPSAADAEPTPDPPGVRRYTRPGAAVTFEAAKCAHAAECVRGLPAVFDTKARPWIQPEHGTVEELETVIDRCPSGALGFERLPLDA